jgi:hypothetical protein
MTRRARRLISNLEKAMIDLAWIGSKPLEEHEGIKTKYEKARQKLDEFINGLEGLASWAGSQVRWDTGKEE